MRNAKRHQIKTIAMTVVVWTFVLAISFPLLWMVTSSFKGLSEITAVPPTLLPRTPDLRNYAALFATDFLIWFMNSIFIASVTVFVVITVATLGAYSLTRFRYRGQKVIFVVVLFTYIFPSVLMVVPLFVIFSRLRLTNTYFSLVVSDMTFALPFSLWLLRSYFLSVPPQLEEAAMIDGASRIRSFVEVVLPLAVPGIITTAIFTFILAWNEYLFASVFIFTEKMKTLPLGIAGYTDTLSQDWGMVMAASVCATIPVLILFGFLQRRLLPDLNAGAAKL